MTMDDVIARHLSKPRLRPYLDVTDSVSAAIRLYRWNLELSGAIHESLGLVEVMLRNTIDRQLQTWNQEVRSKDDGKPRGKNWVKEPASPLSSILNPRGKKGQPRKSTYKSAYQRAVKDSNLRDPSHPRYGIKPNHDDIVAHITFGTWVKLLPSKRDAQTGRIGPGPQRGLWQNALINSFSYHPDPLVIHHWVNRLYLLRNRVAHVEPLIATDVLSYHRTAARLLRAIEPRISDWYAGISRIPEVYAKRP